MFFNKKNTFDDKVWFSKREARFHCVNDLISRKLIIGLSKDEVLHFLGDEFNDLNSDKWSFYLGYKHRFINLKRYNLIVYFNKNGLVYNVSIA